MKIIKENTSLNEIKKIAKSQFGDLVKAVVDIERKNMAAGDELYA